MGYIHFSVDKFCVRFNKFMRAPVFKATTLVRTSWHLARFWTKIEHYVSRGKRFSCNRNTEASKSVSEFRPVTNLVICYKPGNVVNSLNDLDSTIDQVPTCFKARLAYISEICTWNSLEGFLLFHHKIVFANLFVPILLALQVGFF